MNLPAIAADVVGTLGGIGGVWFWAWILNPTLTSNNVWFIAVLFGGMSGTLAYIKEQVQ